MILELISSQSFILVLMWLVLVILFITQCGIIIKLKSMDNYSKLETEVFGTSTAVLSKDLLSAVIISFMVVMDDLGIDVPSIGRQEREIEYFNRLWSIYKKHMYEQHKSRLKESEKND